MISAMAEMRLRLSWTDTADQSANAAFAAATARSNCAFDARGHWATTAPVAGLRTSMARSPSTISPSIRRRNLDIGALPFYEARRCSIRREPDRLSDVRTRGTKGVGLMTFVREAERNSAYELAVVA